jgi:1,4-dihydroxy-6-naphthoate synthase
LSTFFGLLSLWAYACYAQGTGNREQGGKTSNSDKSRAGIQHPTSNLEYVVVPFDQIFKAVRSGQADVGLIIHEGQLTYQNEGLVVCEDLGVWWNRENEGLPLPLGGNVIHKKFDLAARRKISGILTASIQFSLDHRAEAVQHALQYARDMGRDLADKFVGMYVNHWTLDYGERGREALRRFLGQAFERGLIPHRQELEFVV